MVNAGRILIMAQGDWDPLVSYSQLDLVTATNGIAYLARQASVGVNPITDASKTYWQPFGTAVIPDAETIVDDGNGVISVNIDGETLIYDAVNNNVKVSIDGVTLVYDSNSNYLKVAKAGANTLGVVKPDGSTTSINANGEISVSMSLDGLSDVTITPGTLASGQVIGYNGSAFTNMTSSSTAANTSYDNTTSGLSATNVQNAIDEEDGRLDTAETAITTNNTAQNNKHKVTSKQVATTGWTSDTSSQSGTTLYKKTIALSHVYVTSPIVDIGASGVLPTAAEQEAYDLLQYVTINGTTLTLYGSAIPSTAYYINITGVD